MIATLALQVLVFYCLGRLAFLIDNVEGGMT